MNNLLIELSFLSLRTFLEEKKMPIGFPRALIFESSPKFALQIGGQLSETGSYYTAHTGTHDVMASAS